MLLQLRDRVIGDCVSLLLSEPVLQATYDLAGAPQRESNRVPEHFSLRHARENIKRTIIQATTSCVASLKA